MENVEATAKELKFEIRKTEYFKEEYFKVHMPLKLCLRHGHDLAGFFQTEFPGSIEIQNTVERFGEPEIGRTVDVFGKRLVPVDIDAVILDRLDELGEADVFEPIPEKGIQDTETLTIEQAAVLVPTAVETVAGAAANNPSLSALLSGLQAAVPVVAPVITPVAVPAKTKGKKGGKQ